MIIYLLVQKRSHIHYLDNTKAKIGTKSANFLLQILVPNPVHGTDYDPSLTELNAILDENPAVTRMEFCPQQVPPPPSHGGEEPSSNVEWTYLEPVQPSTYALASTNNIEEVMVPITTTNSG